MIRKSIVFMSLLFLLTSCSSSQNNIEQAEVEEITETETQINTETEETEIEPETTEEALTEPGEIMKDWASFSAEKKLELVNQCLEYDKANREAKKEPINIIGTSEQFVSVIDERYAEIEGMDNAEKYRMQNSSVCAQVSIMGHQTNLIEFAY